MGSAIVFDYYYGQEAEQFSFFRIPRVLVKDKRFSSLSSDAKLLYGLLLDRMGLSMANGWMDECNRVYIIYTIQDIQEDLGCAKQKAVKTLAELDSVKGIGLVEKKRRGLGQPDILYVKNFIVKEPDGEDFRTELPVGQRKEEDSECGVEGQPESYFKKYENQTSASPKIKLQEVRKANSKGYENQTSRSSIIEPAEVRKADPNYTDQIYTDWNQNPSIFPERAEPGCDGCDSMDGYRQIIRENIEYDHFMAFSTVSDRELVDELYQLICDVVCVKRDHIRIGGEDYPYEMVKAQFLKLRQPHVEYVLRSMKNTTTKIRDIRSYLLTTLYRAPDTIHHYYRQEVNHDFYREDEAV